MIEKNRGIVDNMAIKYKGIVTHIAISSYEACSSHVYNKDRQGLKLMSEKFIGLEPVITVDKGVGKHTTSKSVSTKYNPLVLCKLETSETCKMYLKLKWPTSKRREKVVNTDFTFQPNTTVQFVSLEDATVA